MKNVKKIFYSIVLLSIFSSCSYDDRDIRFDGNDRSVASEYNYSNLKIVVIDGRNSREKIGNKVFGDQTVRINNYQDLKLLLQNKVAKEFFAENLKIKSPKTLELYLIKLKYNSKRGVKGVVSSNSIMKVVVRDSSKKAIFRKTYKMDFEKEYFVSSTREEDQNNANMIMDESIKKIVTDAELIALLQK